MLQVKIRFFGQDGTTCQEIRRLPMPQSFEGLLEKIRPVAASTNGLILRYIDEQGDAITISTQEEFEIACGIAQETEKKTLEVHVFSHQNPAEIHQVRERKGMMGRLVSQKIEKGKVVDANSEIVEKIRFRNDSESEWPVGCKFVCVRTSSNSSSSSLLRSSASSSSSSSSVTSQMSYVLANPSAKVGPGQEIEISLSLVSPGKPGNYVEFWRLQTGEGVKFGQRVRIDIVVPGNGSSVNVDQKQMWSEQLATLVSLGYTDQHKNMRMLNRHQGNVEAVVEKLQRKEENGTFDRADHCHSHGHGHHGHGHHAHGHHGRDSRSDQSRGFSFRFGGKKLDESLIKILDQIPPKARHLPLEAKLDFLDAYHVGKSRAENQDALAAHDGRLKKTIISLMALS